VYAGTECVSLVVFVAGRAWWCGKPLSCEAGYALRALTGQGGSSHEQALRLERFSCVSVMFHLHAVSDCDGLAVVTKEFLEKR